MTNNEIDQTVNSIRAALAEIKQTWRSKSIGLILMVGAIALLTHTDDSIFRIIGIAVIVLALPLLLGKRGFIFVLQQIWASTGSKPKI